MRYFPVTIFASIMGYTGLSIAYQRAGIYYSWASYAGKILLFVSLGLFTCISLLYLWKIFCFFDEASKDFNHPVRFNFFSAFSVSLLLLSIGSMEVLPELSRVLWLAGAFAHLCFTLIAVSRWITHEYAIQQLNPAWIIPVVGNVLIPIAGVKWAPQELSWFFFSIGIFFWLVLFALLLYRLTFQPHLPANLTPTLFILLAPPSMGFAAYIRLTGAYDLMARVLLHVALFTALLLLTMFRSFVRLPFFLSWWAYTFPLCALTMACLTAFASNGLEVFLGLGLGGLGLVTLVVLLVSYQTIKLVLARKLCVSEE